MWVGDGQRFDVVRDANGKVVEVVEEDLDSAGRNVACHDVSPHALFHRKHVTEQFPVDVMGSAFIITVCEFII